MAKKIGAIVSLSIIGVLILATIIMANVNVNYSIRCNEPTRIYVSYGATTERDVKQADADEIVTFINNASKEKSLTALFNGNLNKKAKVVAASNVGNPISKSSSNFYVRYSYANPQKLMDGKKEFKDLGGNNVYYEDLVFTVADIEESTRVFVYVIPESTNPNSYTYYYELEADFSGLYDFLVEKAYNV